MKQVVLIITTITLLTCVSGFVLIERKSVLGKEVEKEKRKSRSAYSYHQIFNFDKNYSRSQSFSFNIRPNRFRPVSVPIARRASAINDLAEHFPKNWISDYKSVTLTTKNGTEIQSAKGISNSLNGEQQSLLQSGVAWTDIEIKVLYSSTSGIGCNSELKELIVRRTMVPDQEARYPKGINGLRTYMNDKATEKISRMNHWSFENIQIEFGIDNKGQVENVTLKQSSGNKQADRLILEAINQMPLWSPALNENGEAINQAFLFESGQPGC